MAGIVELQAISSSHRLRFIRGMGPHSSLSFDCEALFAPGRRSRPERDPDYFPASRTGFITPDDPRRESTGDCAIECRTRERVGGRAARLRQPRPAGNNFLYVTVPRTTAEAMPGTP